jgi:hypothetical protein
MNVIFDENVPRPLKQFLSAHNVFTVPELGWSGIANGILIQRVDGRYDVLVIADKNLRYQQNLTNRQVAIVELPTNRWPLLRAISSRVAAAIDQAAPGTYTILEL